MGFMLNIKRVLEMRSVPGVLKSCVGDGAFMCFQMLGSSGCISLGVCMCVCLPVHVSVSMYFGVQDRRRLELLFVGGIRPPQVLSNKDKEMACGKIDRGMLCLFRRAHRLHHHIPSITMGSRGREGGGGKERNPPEEPAMIKTTRGGK